MQLGSFLERRGEVSTCFQLDCTFLSLLSRFCLGRILPSNETVVLLAPFPCRGKFSPFRFSPLERLLHSLYNALGESKDRSAAGKEREAAEGLSLSLSQSTSSRPPSLTLAPSAPFPGLEPGRIESFTLENRRFASIARDRTEVEKRKPPGNTARERSFSSSSSELTLQQLFPNSQSFLGLAATAWSPSALFSASS